MKSIYLLLPIVLFTNLSLFSQNIIFEDTNFKRALLNYYPERIDTNKDGEISEEEAKKFTGKLYLNDRNIKSLKGLGYFINITKLNCNKNQLTKIDVSKNTALTGLHVDGNKLTEIDVSKNTKLMSLRIQKNQLTKLDLSKNIALIGLGVYGNQLTKLDVSKNTALKALGVGGNKLTNLDISKNTVLGLLDVFKTKLIKLDVSKNTALWYLKASETKLKSIDLSNCKIALLSIQRCPELRTLNLIGQELDRKLEVHNNPKLDIVCANLDKIDFIDSKLKNNNNGAYKLSTNCTKETLNTITGKVSYAPNIGLCGTTKLKPVNELKLKILTASQKEVKKTITPDTSGNYRTFIPKGSYYLKAELFNPSYFDDNLKPDKNKSSENLIEFESIGETKTKDICVTPKGIFDDLAISISGGRARPNFNVTYTLIYKNIGTTILSGAVNLKIKDLNKQEFVKARPLINDEVSTSAKLTWNFKDLAPFQTKIIYVTFKLNTRTDDAEVNGGDKLKYIATINDTNRVEKEETLGDNTVVLYQEVRNSWDPNDKTCIEGSILRPKNVGKYLTYKIRFENKGTTVATNVSLEDVIDPTKFDINTLQYISSGNHLCVTEVAGDTVNFNFKDINLGFSSSDNKGYVLFKIKTLENLKEGDEINNKASIYFDFNKPVITDTETVVVKKKVEKKLKFSDYFMLTPNPTKGPVDLIEKKKGLKIMFFTINDSYGYMQIYYSGRTRHFNFWYLATGNVYYLRIFTENNGILSTRFIKE